MAARTFVGFGFGPIQSALFLYEAYRSGHFTRFVIAEVEAALVQAVRSAGGRYTINIARPDRIEQATISGVELYDPAVPKTPAQSCRPSRRATSWPLPASVAFFDKCARPGGRALGDGLSLRTAPRPTVIYAAENHNHAAELLREAVAKQLPPLRPPERPSSSTPS